jgi:hypothetical protein
VITTSPSNLVRLVVTAGRQFWVPLAQEARKLVI